MNSLLISYVRQARWWLSWLRLCDCWS